MDGVYLFYTTASASLPGQEGNVTAAFPDPAVIVLTKPQRDASATTTVCDVDLLQLLYFAFPSSFFLLVNPADGAESRIGCASHDAGAAPLQMSAHTREQLRRAQAKVDVFFGSNLVQQRTCRLTLGSRADATAYPRVTAPAQRHSLLLSPLTAGSVMREQPWLKDLHECPFTLFHPAQVAAVLLLAAKTKLFLHTSAALEVVTRCAWVGDVQSAAAVLSCVAHAICQPAAGAWAASGFTALAQAQQRTPPSMPAWVTGGPQEACSGEASPPPPPPSLLPLLEGSKDKRRRAQLCMQEAYSTYTAATATTPAASVVGGFIGISCSAAEAETSRLKGECSSCPVTLNASSGEAMHLIVCTALTGPAGEHAEDAVRPRARHVLPPLLQLLKKHMCDDMNNESSAAAVQFHVSVRGRDVLAQPSLVERQQQTTTMMRDVEARVAPLTACSLAEATERLSSSVLDSVAPLLQFYNEEEGEEDGAAEDVVSYMQRQCNATLRRLQQEAHRHRLLRMRHQRVSQDGPLTPQTTRAAVVLCVDEAHLAQWAESRHPFLPALSSDASREDDTTHAELPSSLRWALYADVPVYVCLLPSAAVTPPLLLSRLCAAPAIEKGVRAARQLCSLTGGFFFIADSPAGQAEKSGAPASGKGDEAHVVQQCAAVVAALVAHLRLWATAVFRSIHYCVLSELPAETQRDATASPAAQRSIALPHCALCTPSAVINIRAAAAQVRLWRCPGGLLSPTTPAIPFLAYEALGARTRGGSQPWAEEMVAHYVFAFADATASADSRCTVSPVVRVQPRLTLCRPGPLLRWYNCQYHLHSAAVRLAAVHAAQVEQLKTMFFVLAATEGGRGVRRGVVSAQAREAQAQAVLTALQRLTKHATQLQEKEKSLLQVLHHLLPFESMEGRNTAQQTGSSALPEPLAAAIQEVEAERRAQLRAQQRKAYQLGEPLAPSSTDTSAAATRLLSLTFLRARLLALHALYAAGGADAVLRQAHQAGKEREEGQSGEETLLTAEREPAVASMVTKRSVMQRASDLYRDVLASASAPTAAQQGEASVHEEVGHRNSPPPAEHAGPSYPYAEHISVFAPAHKEAVAVELETAQVHSPDEQVILSSAAAPAEPYFLPANLPINQHEDKVDVGEKPASCVTPSGVTGHQQMHREAFVRSGEGDGWGQEPRGIFTVDAPQQHTQPAQNTTLPFQPDTTAANTTSLPVPRPAPEVVVVEPAAYASPPVHLHNNHSGSQLEPQRQYHQQIDLYRRRQSFDVRLPSSAERAAYTSCAGCRFDVQPSTAREAYQDVDVVTAPALASPSMPSVRVADKAELNEEKEEAAHEPSPWVYLPGEMKDGEEQPTKTEEHGEGIEPADQEETSAVVVPAADQKSSDSKLSHAGATMQKPLTEGRETRDTYLTVSVHEATPVSPPRPPTPPLTPLEARNVCSANNAAPPQPSAPSCLRCEAEASTVQQDGNALNALPGVAEDLSYLQLAGTMSAAATTQPPIVASAPLDDQLTGGFPMASVDEANGDDGGAQLNATLQREEGSVNKAEEAAAAAAAASDVPMAVRSHTNASPAFQQEERDQEDVQSATSTHASAETCRPNSALRTWRPSACSPSGDSGVAAEQTPPAEGMKTTQRHCRTPLGIPPPPCNMTWWSERAGGAAGAVSAPQQHTTLASLLTEQLPPQATARTAALHVARYAGGRLTVDVMDPTTAFLAAAANTRAGNVPSRVSPAAYIALFTIDVNTGALCLREAHACPIAPGITADMLVEQQSSHMRTRHTFTASLSPGTAVAVIYVGLRHALMKGVARDDVTWLDGIALSVESPAVRQVRVSDIQSDGFCLEWESSSSTAAAAAQAAVKILTTEIATPPPCGPRSFLPGEAGAASGANHTTAAAAASAAAMRGRRRTVNVAHASPAIVTGLRSASIYHVQLIPTPSTRRTVRVAARHRTSSVPSSSSLQLEWAVDADVCVCAVMAATSLAPSPDMVSVREVSVVDAHQSAAPSVTGVITCPMLHYRTAVFPLSLLRHCALVDTSAAQQKPNQKAQADVPFGAASAHQLVRLHWTMAPLLGRDTGNDTTSSEECGSAADGFHIAVAGGSSSSSAAGRLGGNDGLISARSRRSSRCFAYSDTCRHVFRVHAGAGVNVALSLCVQLDAELVSLTALRTKDAGPVALHYVSLLEALQRSVLPFVLGPFHVCRVPLNVRCDGPSVSELAWEGTCPVFEVVVRKRRTEASAALADAALPPTESHVGATAVPREDGSRPSTANEDEDEQTYQVKGRLVVKDGAGSTAAAAEDGVVAGPPPLYRGVLRLSALHPSSEYEARVRCATHHVGEHLQCLWHTRPLPPPRRALSVVFDSDTHCLHLRFTQHLVGDEQQVQLVDAPRAFYHAVVAPLGTSITVPVWAAAAEKKSNLTVHRVVDCSVVESNTPISLYLRRRVEWPTSTTQHKEEALVSSDVVYVVVSGIRVSMVYSGVAKNVPMLELAWICCEGHEVRSAAMTAPSEDQAPPVAYVELNRTHRVRVKAEARNRVRLALSQLRCLAAVASTTLSAGLLTEAPREDEVKEDCEGFLPHSWSGVVCITAFVSSARTTSQAGWPCAPIVVPDRCLPVILPPPPALPLSVLVTRNYESEASVDVDVGAVYSLYYAALACTEHKKEADEPGHRCTTSHLAGVLRQRVRLALDVQRKGVGLSDNMVQQLDVAERYPLQPPSGQQSQHREQQQRVRISLPSYRPYDGHLCLSLHVSIAEDPRDGNPPADRVDANREGDTRRYRFFIPADLSPTHICVPVPPAEPIADIAVSAISACDAVLDWTPPQSLLRRLRQQPPIDVSYAVHLFSATAAPTSDTATLAASNPLREPVHVWVSAVPHLVLNALEPATPYVVMVRGTGCGDYYATVRFVTAPVVAGAVVTQLRSALTVEAVVQRGGGVVESTARGRGRGVASVEGVEKSPALWTVLPASDVVRWTLPSHLCSDVRAASAAEGLSVEVATHYSLCLVAATGELLRRWTSSPGTTTTVYHEWEPRSSAVAAAAAREAAAEAGDDVSSTPSMWPHLEVMAHAELLMGASSSSLSPGDGGTAAAAAAVTTLFTLPHACHSGAYHRTRLDLIGMARLVEPQSSETCVVSWEGSCREGYHLSWCLSPSLGKVQHAKLPAGTQMPCVFSLPSAALSDVVGEGSVAGDGPVFALLCVSGGGRRAQRSRTSGASPSLSMSPTGVVEGGSNVLCVAWLLQHGGPAHGAPQKVALVRQASDKVTLLLPRDCPVGTLALSAVGEAAGTAPCDLTRAVRSLLTRTWAITAPRSLLLRRWPREAYATCDLPSDGSVSLVDVHLSSSGQAQEAAMVELQCVDAVAGKQSAVWQQLVAHVVDVHQRWSGGGAQSESGAGGAGGSSAVPVLPSLRWLRTIVETRRAQPLRHVRTLQSLELVAVEECSEVRQPPLLSTTLIDGSAAGEAAGAADNKESFVQRLRLQWLPLRTAAAPEKRTRDEVGGEQPCALQLRIGEPHDGEEGPKECKGSEAAARTQATLSELSALQAWGQRGHPTLCARLAWVSDDDVFVLRVAGPYETAAAATSQVGNNTTADNQHRDQEPPLPQVIRALLNPNVFPTLSEMPHQRTYTCVTPPCSAAAASGLSGGHIALQPNGEVRHVVAVRNTGTRAENTDAKAAVVLSSPCQRFTAVVDGLVPEAFYRLQVTGVHSGDVALRVQFVTPPSALTQVVTVGDAPEEKRAGADVHASAPAMQVHARLYNPHAYAGGNSGAGSVEQHRGSMLAPGVRYESYAALEVRSQDAVKCLRDHRTYWSLKEEDEEGAQGCSSQPQVVEKVREEAKSEAAASLSTTTTAFTVAVEGPVEVYAVHHLRVFTDTTSSFLQTQHWGPLLLAPSPHASYQPAMSTRVELPICFVPGLPRVEKLTVQRRTPHSLRLSWRWRSGQYDVAGTNSSSNHRHDPARAFPEAEAPPTLLCVRCRRVSQKDTRLAPPQQQQQHVGDICTLVVPATTSPAVTLAPLQPGALYVVGIQEIPREQAAGARAAAATASPASPLASLFAVTPPTAAHAEGREGDLYAIRILPLPPDVAAAVRALGRVSARPSSLLLRPARRTDLDSLPRGAVRCYALTSSSLRHATASWSLVESVRRRPGLVSLTLPRQYGPPCRRGGRGDAAGEVKEVRVLSYTAVVVVPENTVYIPAEAVAEVQSWWESTVQRSGDAASSKTLWEWWADRLRTTLEREGETQSTERHAPASGTKASSVGTADTATEHWTSELARRLFTRPRATEKSNALSAWPLLVRPMEAVKGGNGGAASTSAPWCFTVPVDEPTCTAKCEDEIEGSRSASPHQEWVRRTLYLVHCLEALPARSSCGVLGVAQQLTVCHAPIAVKRLQLLRDVCVRSTPSSAADGLAELRVTWRWPQWAQPSFGTEQHSKKSKTGTAAQPQPRCTARLTCTPLPPTSVDDADTASPSAAPASAAFLQHVDGTQREATVTGLSPSTLYRLVFDEVRHGTGSTAVQCAETAVTALTPPSPPEPSSLPKLHYTRFPKGTNAAGDDGAGTGRDGSDYGGAAATPAVEVRFDLPHARCTSQNLLVCWYAVLVHREVVVGGACTSAEDFLAVAEEVNEAATATAAGTAPVVYCNVSQQQRLRTRITLRQQAPLSTTSPLLPQYALVFFTGVRMEGSGRDATANQAEKGSAESAPAKVMYSAPAVRLLQFPETPLAHKLHEGLVNRQRWLRCRPAHLVVHERTPTSLVLRWQLDLTAARLSDLERLRLLRCGVFAVHVAPDWDSGASATNSSLSSLAGRRQAGERGGGQQDGEVTRTVFYRANASTIASTATTPSCSDIASVADQQRRSCVSEVQKCVRRIAVSEYLTNATTKAADTTTDEDAAKDDAGAGNKENCNVSRATAAVVSSPACLTYELIYPCPTPAAAHVGYTVEVSLLPDWMEKKEEKAAGGISPRSRSLRPTPVNPPPAATLTIPPVVLPLPVQRIVATDVTQTSCTLEWFVADGERPSAYAVHYTPNEELAEGGVVWVRSGQQSVLTLRGLSPQTSYTVCVVPCNAYEEPCEEDNAVLTVRTASLEERL